MRDQLPLQLQSFQGRAYLLWRHPRYHTNQRASIRGTSSDSNVDVIDGSLVRAVVHIPVH